MRDYLYSAFPDLEQAYKAGLAAAPTQGADDTQVVIAGLNALLHDAQDEIARLTASQGADGESLRPVAIYQVYMKSLGVFTDTTQEVFESNPTGERRIVYATRATPADHISPEPFGYVYRIISEMRPHDPMYRFAKTGELNPDPEVARSWTKHVVYLAPQAPQSRDSVIEQCAMEADKAEDGFKTMERKQTASYIAYMIRALKSQQDAAIESQRSGDGS